MSTTIRRRELKNVRAYFIPAGEVVDSVTVAQATWPDNDPAANYTDYEFEDIESLAEEVLTEEEPRLLGRESGGYYQDTTTHFRGRRWTATTVKTNNIIKRLQNQLAANAVIDTAQAPGVVSTPQIDGVFLYEVKGNSGDIIERLQIWARLTLTDPGEANPQTAVLQTRWEQLPSANNTYIAL